MEKSIYNLNDDHIHTNYDQIHMNYDKGFISSSNFISSKKNDNKLTDKNVFREVNRKLKNKFLSQIYIKLNRSKNASFKIFHILCLLLVIHASN